MGLLYKAKVYMVCQLQNGNFDQVKIEHDWFKEKMVSIGVTVLSPLEKMFVSFDMECKELHKKLKMKLAEGDFDFVHEKTKLIRNRDLAACDLSTFIVAKIDPSIATWGAIDEIVTSKRMGRPVFLIIEGGFKNCPLWLCSYFKPSWVYNDYNEVVERLYQIDRGEVDINPKTWKILDESLR